MAVMVAGSFVLTPATAVRYERHDRKVRQLTKEEELGVRKAARKVDMREEYYVSFNKGECSFLPAPWFPFSFQGCGIGGGGLHYVHPCLQTTMVALGIESDDGLAG